MAALPAVAYSRAAARKVFAGTPKSALKASGEFFGNRINVCQRSKACWSQRASINAWSCKPSVKIVWAIALINATLVPGRNFKWCSALICGPLTKSMRRGSATINSAPARSRFFNLEANTGWASVGLAPITMITSAADTESKAWVPADSPSVVLSP